MNAELFSKFIADNGSIIQSGVASNLTEYERQVVRKIKESQIKASQYYKAIRVLTPAIKKFLEKQRLNTPPKIKSKL